MGTEFVSRGVFHTIEIPENKSRAGGAATVFKVAVAATRLKGGAR